MKSRWGSLPIIGGLIQNNSGLIIGVVVVGVVLLFSVWSLGPVVGALFTPPSIPGEPSSSQAGSQASTQAPAQSNEMVTPELSFGGQGTGPGLFNDVRGLGVNSSTGSIFAADYEDGRVQAFDPTGKFLTQWMVGSGGKGAIITGMTADSSGNVFIATGGKILRYDAAGKLKGTLTAGHTYIDHVALAPDGNLVVMADQETLLRMSTSGKVLSTIKNAFTANGGDTELDAYVAEDSAGDIYALGTFNNAVFKFSPQGKFIQRFGEEGNGPGQLRAAESIAVDSQGRVYVGDSAGIQIFDADGNYQSLIMIKGAARYIVFDGQDQMYVTTSQNQVLKMSVPLS
jgi:sugar lactone lactonase YvrE